MNEALTGGFTLSGESGREKLTLRLNAPNTRMLLNLMLWAGGKGLEQQWLTDNPAAECAWYPVDRKLVVINNTDQPQETAVATDKGPVHIHLPPYASNIQTLN